jgi:hypothetical protein
LIKIVLQRRAPIAFVLLQTMRSASNKAYGDIALPRNGTVGTNAHRCEPDASGRTEFWLSGLRGSNVNVPMIRGGTARASQLCRPGSVALLCAIDNHRERRRAVVTVGGDTNRGAASTEPMQANMHRCIARTARRSETRDKAHEIIKWYLAEVSEADDLGSKGGLTDDSFLQSDRAWSSDGPSPRIVGIACSVSMRCLYSSIPVIAGMWNSLGI